MQSSPRCRRVLLRPLARAHTCLLPSPFQPLYQSSASTPHTSCPRLLPSSIPSRNPTSASWTTQTSQDPLCSASGSDSSCFSCVCLPPLSATSGGGSFELTVVVALFSPANPSSPTSTPSPFSEPSLSTRCSTSCRNEGSTPTERRPCWGTACCRWLGSRRLGWAWGWSESSFVSFRRASFRHPLFFLLPFPSITANLRHRHRRIVAELSVTSFRPYRSSGAPTRPRPSSLRSSGWRINDSSLRTRSCCSTGALLCSGKSISSLSCRRARASPPCEEKLTSFPLVAPFLLAACLRSGRSEEDVDIGFLACKEGIRRSFLHSPWREGRDRRREALQTRLDSRNLVRSLCAPQLIPIAHPSSVKAP